MNKGIFKRFLIVLLLLALINVYFINIINPVMASRLEEDPEPEQPSITTGSISGNVWEDSKNSVSSSDIPTGDGIYQEGENLIEGFSVQLYSENNDSEPILETFTNSDGFYKFENVPAGRYRVRFNYSNDINFLKYNGHDYKSTANEVPETINIGNKPLDVAILVDTSSSMNTLPQVQESLKILVERLLNNNTIFTDINISILSFNSNPKIECSFTNDLSTLYSAIDNFVSIGTTNTAAGLIYAQNCLNGFGSSDDIKVLLLYTDGVPVPVNRGILPSKAELESMGYKEGTSEYNEAAQKSVSNQIFDKTGRNIYALQLYGEYFDRLFEENNGIVNSYYLNEKEHSFVQPIIINERINISEFEIDNFEDAKGDLAVRTQEIWNGIGNNIKKFAIAVSNSFYSNDTLPTFKYIFGEENSIFLIDDTFETVKKTIEDDVFTTYMVEIDKTQENVAYGMDSQEARLELMEYSQNMNYENGSLLNIENCSNKEEFIKNVSMYGITPTFTLFAGLELKNVNFAIEERPKASVHIEKHVTHLKITLSDGNTLIDWEPNQNVKHLMVLPGKSLTAIMDDELTHGATIQIEYKILIQNKNEMDNLANYFTNEFLNNVTNNDVINRLLEYYGTTNLQDIMYKYIPTQYYIYDYLNNNLIFDETNSPNYWTATYGDISISDIVASNAQTILEINRNQLDKLYLLPEEKCELKLSTSKLMTIADADLSTYDNYVEVVQYSSILGRRMYNTIPGNLNIYDEERVKNLEPDEAKAETVTRVPPFGKDLSYYTTVIGIIVLAIEIVILSTLKIKIKHLKNAYIRKR